MQNLDSIKAHIDAGLFLRGLTLAGLAYILLFIVLWLQSDKTIEQLEQHLASQTVLIKRSAEDLASKPAYVIEKPHAEPGAAVQDTDAEEDEIFELRATQNVGAANKAALASAPVDGIFEHTESGTLPIINQKSGLTPFNAYKHPFTGTNKPMIALLVDDYGLSDTASETAIKLLPSEVTLLLSPYSNAPDIWQEKARKAGHEIWMDVPFENADYPVYDPGPRVLLTTASLKQNEDNITWNLSRTTGYAGISVRTDYVFDGAGTMLQPLMKFTFGRGLGYIELNPAASDYIETLAVNANAPYAKADVHINEATEGGSPFKKLEFIAQQKGYAVGVLKPRSSTLRGAAKWLQTLDQKGITLAPISAIAERGVKERPQKAAPAVASEYDDTHAPEPSHNDHH